jgi:hypothetical protein
MPAPTVPTRNNHSEFGLMYEQLLQFNHMAEQMELAAGAQVQLAEGGVLSVNRTITSTQLLALNAIPQELVGGPGATKALIFEGAIVHKPAGTAYAGVAGGEDLAIRYVNGSGEDVGVVETTGFLDSTGAQTRYMRPQTGALAAGTVSEVIPIDNGALVLHLLVGEVTTGDSPLHLRVFYRVIPMVLP